MMTRRGLIAGSAGMSLAGRGGLTPRRPDQAYNPPAGVVIAPGSSKNLRARSLVLFGTGNGVGLFEYSGTPALGNNPVAYAVPPGVTKDPYGNTLPVSNGFVTVDSGVGILSRLTGNTLQFRSTSSPPNATPVLTAPNASAAGTLIILNSGKGTAAATGIVAQLFDSLQDAAQGGTGVPQMVINSGPAANPVTSAMLEIQGSISTTALASIQASGSLFAAFGNVDVQTAGSGLRVAEGANAKQGTAVLVAGTVTVANTSVTASSRIFLTCQVPGGTPGFLRISARTAGTSFTILSSSATDTSTVAYQIFEPG